MSAVQELAEQSEQLVLMEIHEDEEEEDEEEEVKQNNLSAANGSAELDPVDEDTLSQYLRGIDPQHDDHSRTSSFKEDDDDEEPTGSVQLHSSPECTLE